VDAVVARRNRVRARVADLRARHEWLDHLSRTGERYFQQRGNHFAAAVTFFSVLTAVPLLMVAFGVAGFVLWLNPTLLDDLQDAITAAVPGPLAEALNPIIDEAVAQRNAVAGLGLLAALWSGIWWTSNLREAVSAQWGLPAIRPTSVARFWHDLRVLVVLGVTLLGSISVSVLATGALDAGLDRLGLAEGGVGSVLPAAAAVLLGLATGFLVFYWVIVRLPRMRVPRRGAVQAALVGAVGFEVLKQAIAFYLAEVTGTPGGVVFGPLFGLLLFLYLVARFALLLTAWTATARGNELPAELPAPAPGLEPAELEASDLGSATRFPAPEPGAAAPGPSSDPGPAAEQVPAPHPEHARPTGPGAGRPSSSAGRAAQVVRPRSTGALAAALGVGVLLGAWLRDLHRLRAPRPDHGSAPPVGTPRRP
jgi:membrane protein